MAHLLLIYGEVTAKQRGGPHVVKEGRTGAGQAVGSQPSGNFDGKCLAYVIGKQAFAQRARPCVPIAPTD
jgi:hypothetical protein